MTTNTTPSGADARQARPPGIDALQCVIASLRDTAHFADEEGDLTNDLRALRDWAFAQVAQDAPQSAAQQGIDERGAFESIFKSDCGATFDRDENGFYKSVFVGEAWKVWQARAALAAQAQEAAPRDSLHDCALGDSNYAAGMLLGWNLCTDGRDEDFRRIREDRLRAAASASKEAHEAAPAAQGEPSDTERNAARYLWLRERISVWRTNDGKGPVSWFPVIKVPASSGIQDETDAAIDQSIAAQQKGASNG